ncbi:MAG: hypothetical protein JST80_06790 [Bdellovibrionales bacterium]|nr:hypothetical protein [Bdellovibrionales bacterium]
MARDGEKRKSIFDDDEDEEEVLSPARKALKSAATPTKGRPEDKGKLFSQTGTVDSQTLDIKLGDIKALMDQTHQLYNHYFNGIEKRPPIEKVRLLESRMAELQRAVVTTPTNKFKVSQFVMQYNTFRDLWQRKMREKEKS